MIQIIAQRKFDGATKAVFTFTAPPLVVPSLATIFKSYNLVLDKLDPDERFNLFYTLAHHAGTQTATKPQRTASTFEYQTVLPFDIDVADTQRALEYAAAVGEVIAAPVTALTVVNSGNGVHVLAALRHPIRNAAYFNENRNAYKEICAKVEAKLKERGLPFFVVDPTVFEPARVLRLPGTRNEKPDKPAQECLLVQYAETQLDLDLYQLSGLASRESENVSPQEIKRKYPAPDFQEMVKECRFVDWALTNPGQLHEPQVFDLMSLLAPQKQDAIAKTPCGEKAPEALAEHIFKSATASDSLKNADFGEKWKQAGEYGGRKCSTIQGRVMGVCEKCPHWGKIATPLALKSKEHLASEPLGFWVLNGKGNPMHPAYEDLAKVFKQKTPYTVTEDARIFTFTGTHYELIADLSVKAWLEQTVRPTEPLREAHRNEFLHKVKAYGAGFGLATEDFFMSSTRGKLNCANGVLDIIKGQVVPHAPEYGFKYVLPYAVPVGHPGSELFLDWLGSITQERSELMESILDLMAYTLWPSYDDHLFAYFVGTGANGKSTLIHIIQAMVGSKNYSTVGIQQLGMNRFAPAQLEGKLVNLSEEASGGGQELDHEAMNTVKTLSAGGTMLVERKGQDGFMFTNQAKLIFSANEPPRFRETGHAIKRRMLAIPFDHRISDPDPRVEQRLISEVPQIVAMLIRRIQDNIASNGGRFIVSRGGMAAEQAQTKLLYGNSNVVRWAEETLESTVALGSDQFIIVDDAYAHYRRWAEQNGFAERFIVTKVAFGRVMCDAVITKAHGASTTRKVNGATVRIYTHTKYKEGIPRAIS